MINDKKSKSIDYKKGIKNRNSDNIVPNRAISFQKLPVSPRKSQLWFLVL